MRVAVSRTLGWLLFGEMLMLCAILERRRHPARHVFDLANRWRHKRHCELCADWEAFKGCQVDLLADWRREGWL